MTQLIEGVVSDVPALVFLTSFGTLAFTMVEAFGNFFVIPLINFLIFPDLLTAEAALDITAALPFEISP